MKIFSAKEVEGILVGLWTFVLIAMAARWPPPHTLSPSVLAFMIFGAFLCGHWLTTFGERKARGAASS